MAETRSLNEFTESERTQIDAIVKRIESEPDATLTVEETALYAEWQSATALASDAYTQEQARLNAQNEQAMQDAHNAHVASMARLDAMYEQAMARLELLLNG